ncbi:MAG: aldehyde dehydrogenase family protein, partial [Actinomycetota bacterium]|nr:aldehyde dehydrogenase family protein [Actinomycetota bacterium]
MGTFQNFINGKFVDAEGGDALDVINPATGETYAQSGRSGAKDVDEAKRAAEAAFEGWANATPSERSRAMLRIADAVEAR